MNYSYAARAVLLGVLVWPVTASIAADQQSAGTLVLADNTRLTGQLVQLLEGTLELKGADDDAIHSFQPGQWIRWNNPVEPAARPRVHLWSSSRVVAKRDWTGNVPITIEPAEVIVENATFGSTRIPREQVRCVLLEAAEEPATAAKLLHEASEVLSDFDRIWLINGDLLTGRVARFDGSNLELDLAGETISIAAGRVAAVAFSAAQPGSSTPDPAYLIGLEDGSVIEATDVRAAPNQLELTTPAGTAWKASDNLSVVYVQSLAPEIRYLSDLEEVDYRHTPYFTGSWHLARDRNLLGQVLSAGGERFAKGLAMHSASRAVFRVPAGSKRFCSEVAIDDASGERGSVVFRVYKVTSDGLTPAYESSVLRGSDPTEPVCIEVAGSAAIVLIVDYADFGDELDHAAWLDARFTP